MRRRSPVPVGQRGMALLAVLFALTLLLLLSLPFAVSMSVGANAAMRDVEQVSTEQASASVRDVLLSEAGLSNPTIDVTPGYDGVDEWPGGVDLPPAFQGIADEGRVLLGGEVVDLQRFLALDSASPLLLANVIGTVARLGEDLQPDAGTMKLDTPASLPPSGVVWVQGELIRYAQRDGSTLLELERGLLKDQGFADGTQPIPAEALVLDYRCVLACAWPFLGRGDGSRRQRSPFRSVGEFGEIAAAGLGTFTVNELDAFARVFAVETRAATAGTWGRPERVFNELLPGETRTLTVKSALHLGAGSTVRLRDLKGGAVEYSVIMASEQVNTQADLTLPSMFNLTLLAPTAQPFPAADTVVEPLVPAPVNVNTASLDVLLAILSDVRPATKLQLTDPSGRRQAAPPYITRAIATELANEIVTLRTSTQAGGGGPFTGWQDLVQRLLTPRIDAEGNNAHRNKWLMLYRNLRTGRDSVVEMGTAPICFASGPWVSYRAAASRSRSVVAPGIAARHERTGIAAAVPGFRLEHHWTTQEEFENAFVLDRRAPHWITAPINLGHPVPGELGNDPAPRYFPHLVPVAYPSIGLGAPRFPVVDIADSGVEAATSTTPMQPWPQQGGAPPGGMVTRPQLESFATANHRRGRQLPQDGPYMMVNNGPNATSSSGGAGGNQGNTGGNNTGSQQHRLSFPFSTTYGFMNRFGISFWLEPQRLDSVVVFDHNDGNSNRNRASVQGLNGNLIFEVLDEAGLDPNPSQSPAGVMRTASSCELPLAQLNLPANTPVHLSMSAPSGRPADLSFAIDGVVRSKPRYVTYLTSAIPVYDPQQNIQGQQPGLFVGPQYLNISVESTQNFPPVGVLRIGLELFEYSAINGNSFQCQFKDSLGGRGARMRGSEFIPTIPLDNTGKPTVDIRTLQQQGINLGVFPMHPVGSQVELYGYSALPSDNTTPMMVGSTTLSGTVGEFAVARGFIQNPRNITINAPPLPPFNIGVGIDQNWTGDLMLADPIPSGNMQPPAPAQANIQNGFPTGGGYALLVQIHQNWGQSVGAAGGSAEFGGVELVQYTSRNGNVLSGVQRAQQLPGQDGQIDPNEYNGSARRFVTNYLGHPLPNSPQVTFDMLPTYILFVVPVSLSLQSTNFILNPQNTQHSEWVQLYTNGTPNDTEWVRYDTIAGNNSIVRANRAAWNNTRFQLTRATGLTSVTVSGLPPSVSGINPPPPTTPPWGTVQATSGYIGYTPQIEATYPQIHAARRALQFRGDPFTGTSSHIQNNAQVTACHRLQLNWNNYGAYSGRAGRNDRIALVNGSTAASGSRPNVEWHTVNWSARRFESDQLAQQTPPERLGPWPFQLVAFTDAVRVPLLGQPIGTVVDDPRRFDRMVKFPSGELPAAYCMNPVVGSGINNAQPMTGIVDEIEVVGHVAADLVLDVAMPSSAQQFTVNRAVTMLSNGGRWFQTDLSAQFPMGGGLVQIDGEILAFQSHQNGIFNVAVNGRGLLNTMPRDHDRGARVMFLTHRPAAILANGLGAEEATLRVQNLGALPQSGTLLNGRELLHYTWVRRQANSIEMPRWYPPDGSDSRGRGLFRGRYGTLKQGAGNGQPLIWFPFRYWDRYHEDSDDPELAYFQMTANEAPSFLRTLRWRQETQDARVQLICRARTDGVPSWIGDPATTPGLWEFRGSSDEQTVHRLDRQASRLELRFLTEYKSGAIDLQAFSAHGWKTTARVENVRVEYEGQGRVFDEQVTAR